MTTRQQPRTGRPIVVWVNTHICDGCGQEVNLWTDGFTAYAETNATHEATLLEREGLTITVVCGYARDGARCGGTVMFKLIDEAWTSNAVEIGVLVAHGRPFDNTEAGS